MVEVIEALKWEVFLLNLLDYLLWQLFELSQWRHRLPPVQKIQNVIYPSWPTKQGSAIFWWKSIKDSHSLVNHLAEIHGLVCQLSPAPVQYNLKYGSH